MDLSKEFEQLAANRLRVAEEQKAKRAKLAKLVATLLEHDFEARVDSTPFIDPGHPEAVLVEFEGDLFAIEVGDA